MIAHETGVPVEELLLLLLFGNAGWSDVLRDFRRTTHSKVRADL
jgi:hypothetical protein